ncbi:MAG: DUF4198 domain-containing protein [Gemmatimonadetes bacterium]|nr:DUF4198 domain-containing protein [Gemmatimonadota bacterium]
MRRSPFVVTAVVLLSAIAASAVPARAHDLFLTLRSFFAPPQTAIEIHALNGTFSSSVAVVARDRMIDVSVWSPAGRARLDTTAWLERRDTTVLTLRTGGPGTYAVGVSTRPRILALKAPDFNAYLASEGVPEVLAARRRDGELDRPARERYSKHVKALIQVGDAPSGAFGAVFGYPAEIVPLDNPYALRAGPGSRLRVRALVGDTAQPALTLQVGGRDLRGARLPQREIVTDSAGIAELRLVVPGRYYVKFIRMRRLVDDAAADYESRWATLTFELR